MHFKSPIKLWSGVRILVLDTVRTSDAMPGLHGLGKRTFASANLMCHSSAVVTITGLILCHVAIPAAASPANDTAIVRDAYLQKGFPDSVTVCWRTSGKTYGRVRYGTAPNHLDRFQDDVLLGNPSGTVFGEQKARFDTEHEVVLSGLNPSTRYYYSIGTPEGPIAGGDESYSFVTAPLVGASSPVRVWVVGDQGTGSRDALAVRDSYYRYNREHPLTSEANTNLWLTLGDNAYSNGRDEEFTKRFFDIYPHMLRQSVLWPALGNHDSAQSSRPSKDLPYFKAFRLPEQGNTDNNKPSEAYYSFDYGNIHFVCLDSVTASSRQPDSKMVDWLKADLGKLRHSGRIQSTWIVAYLHHPPYTDGTHGSDNETEMVQIRENIVPILEEYGVDLVLGGHSHNYERSYLIDGHYRASRTFRDAMLVDGGNGREDGDGAYYKNAVSHGGTVYVVAGSSGQNSNFWNMGPMRHPAMYQSSNDCGSLVLDVQGNRLDVKFVTAAGSDGAWRIKDYFTILKN